MPTYNIILNKIESFEISEEKIQKANIPQFQRIILLVAFYQYNHFPKSQILGFLNQAKDKYKDYPQTLGIIITLLSFIKKQKYYKGFYEGLLETEVQELQAETITFNQRLELLLNKEEYNIVTRLCGAKMYFNDAEIQKYHIQALIKLNRIDEALKLCMRPTLFTNPDIQDLLHIVKTLKEIEDERQAITAYYDNLIANIEIPLKK